MAEISKQRVEFESGGTRLVGHLHTNGQPSPAIVVTGSWTTVKEQMPDLYAGKLAERGFTALTFDFAGFGESEGEPRQFEEPSAKIDDIAAAARFLAARDEVSGPVGGLAVCASAGYMAHAIACGAPIAAFVTVAAWLHDSGSVGDMYDGDEGLAERIAAGEAARAAYETTGEVRTVPAFSEDDPEAAMGAMVKDYYGDPRVGAPPEWVNALATLSWPAWLTFDAVSVAPFVKAPTLMVHSKDAAFPDNVRRFAKAHGGEAKIAWHEGTQIDFYHAPTQVNAAVAEAAEHFRRHLGKAGDVR